MHDIVLTSQNITRDKIRNYIRIMQMYYLNYLNNLNVKEIHFEIMNFFFEIHENNLMGLWRTIDLLLFICNY